MNSILVLVDLTPASSISVDQAINLAKHSGAAVTLSYIAGSEEELHSQELESKLAVYKAKLGASGIAINLHIVNGDFKQEALAYVNTNRPDLVVATTHGMSGIKQAIFGSNIYHLVKDLPTSTIVFSEFTTGSNQGFNKILLPVAAHENYLSKVKKSCALLADGGEIIVFNIVKTGLPLDKSISDNIEATRDLLTEKGVKFKMENLESTKFSIGYSKEMLDYSVNNNIDLISIMTSTSTSDGGVSSDADREALLLNKNGIPIFCAR